MANEKVNLLNKALDETRKALNRLTIAVKTVFDAMQQRSTAAIKNVKDLTNEEGKLIGRWRQKKTAIDNASDSVQDNERAVENLKTAEQELDRKQVSRASKVEKNLKDEKQGVKEVTDALKNQEKEQQAIDRSSLKRKPRTFSKRDTQTSRRSTKASEALKRENFRGAEEVNEKVVEANEELGNSFLEVAGDAGIVGVAIKDLTEVWSKYRAGLGKLTKPVTKYQRVSQKLATSKEDLSKIERVRNGLLGVLEHNQVRALELQQKFNKAYGVGSDVLHQYRAQLESINKEFTAVKNTRGTGKVDFKALEAKRRADINTAREAFLNAYPSGGAVDTAINNQVEAARLTALYKEAEDTQKGLIKLLRRRRGIRFFRRLGKVLVGLSLLTTGVVAGTRAIYKTIRALIDYREFADAAAAATGRLNGQLVNMQDILTKKIKADLIAAVADISSVFNSKLAKDLRKVVDALDQSVENALDSESAGKLGEDLDKLNVKIQKNEAKLTVRRAASTLIFTRQKSIIEDVNASLKDRLKAYNELHKGLKEQVREELIQQQNKISALQKERRLSSKPFEFDQKIAEAKQEFYDIQTRDDERRREARNQYNGIIEEYHNQLIQEQDTAKTIFERERETRALTSKKDLKTRLKFYKDDLDKRVKLLDEQRKLGILTKIQYEAAIEDIERNALDSRNATFQKFYTDLQAQEDLLLQKRLVRTKVWIADLKNWAAETIKDYKTHYRASLKLLKGQLENKLINRQQYEQQVFDLTKQANQNIIDTQKTQADEAVRREQDALNTRKTNLEQHYALGKITAKGYLLVLEDIQKQEAALLKKQEAAELASFDTRNLINSKYVKEYKKLQTQLLVLKNLPIAAAGSEAQFNKGVANVENLIKVQSKHIEKLQYAKIAKATTDIERKAYDDEISNVAAAIAKNQELIKLLKEKRRLQTEEGTADEKQIVEDKLQNLYNLYQAEINYAEYAEGEKDRIKQKYAELDRQRISTIKIEKKRLDEQDAQNSISLARHALNTVGGFLDKQSAGFKFIAITTSIIDGILAVQKALASGPPPGNLIAAKFVGVQAAINTAAIAAQSFMKFPKAEQGGVFNVRGKRHSAGGTKLFDAAGTPVMEVEKGELINVLSRRAAKSYRDIAMNNVNSNLQNVNVILKLEEFENKFSNRNNVLLNSQL